jgi:hypothetical protein
VRSNPRHLRLLPAALVTIVVLLGACTGQEQTKSYSKTVEKEFLFGCTTGGDARMDDGSYVQSDTTDPAEKEAIEEAKARMKEEVPEIDAICACTYDKLEEDVEFEDLKKITNDLERDPDELPDSLTEISDACAESEGGASPN